MIFAGIFCLALASVGIGQPAEVQKPLTVMDIEQSLRETKAGLPTTNRILIKRVREQGLDFEIDAAIEKRLRNNGANDELISNIREKLCEVFSNKANACPKDDYKCQVANYNKALEFHPLDFRCIC
ncbi:MAG: hypothetical protein WKF92_00180 [Pyrinomonadaceae bacterium]